MCIHNHIIAAMVAGGAWLFAGIGVLISPRRLGSPDNAAPLPAALDRRQGAAPSWIGVLRDANVSLFRGGAGTAHGAAIYGIFQSAYPLRRSSRSMSSAKSPLTRNPPKVGSFIRRGPIVSQESELLFGRRQSRVVVSVGRPRFKASRQ